MNNLFSPLKIKSMELKNRVVMSPMQQYSATDGIPNDWHLVHLGSRAVGGAGLIITECTAVSPQGMNTVNDLGIWNETQVHAWKPIVKFVQAQGAKIAIQLWHAGGKGSHKHPNEGMKPLPISEGGWIVKSSSATVMGGIVPEELTFAEIQEIKADFVRAALRATVAGFDSIELHAGHGYLFHQFYSSMINHRHDQYGGSFENRIRLLVEVMQEIRKVIPADMPLMARISTVDYADRPDTWSLEESIHLSKILKDNGIDLITASGGGFVQVDQSLVFPNYQVPFAKAIREKNDILTGAVGMISEANQANDIITQGEADLVVIAREHLRNPYFATHAALELEMPHEIPWQYKRGYPSGH